MCNLLTHSFPPCNVRVHCSLAFIWKNEALWAEEASALLRCSTSRITSQCMCSSGAEALGTAVPSWIIYRGELWWWMISCKQCITLRENKRISLQFPFFSPRGGAEPQVSPWQDNFSDGGTLNSWSLFSDDPTGLLKTFPNRRRWNSSDGGVRH